MENPLVYTHKFKVKGHDVNADKYLTIPSLMRSMQECSLQHARNLKTSVWDMEDDHITWVLLRKELTILDLLKLDDTYTIITYPAGFEKFFAFRDYLVFNAEKKLVAAASSTWTLIDTKTRKLSRIPIKILDIGAPKDVKFLKQANKTLDIAEPMKYIDVRKVRPYDLDWNNHINNIVLVRYMMEGIKINGLQDQQVSNLLVHFKNEIELGGEVNVLHREEDDKNYLLLNSKDEKVIAACIIELRSSRKQ